MSGPSRYEVSMTRNERVAPEVHLLHFELPPGKSVEFAPGQYVTFELDQGGHPQTKSYSFASAHESGEGFDLLVKRIPQGFASNFLCDAVSGTRLSALMPLGKFALRDPGGRSVLLLATGTGLAPFLPMLEELERTHPTTPTYLVVGFRFERDVIFPEQLRALAERWPAFHYFPVLSRPPPRWPGGIGHLQGVVRQKFATLRDVDVYICGVPAMVGQAQQMAADLRAPPERVFVERY